MVDEGDGTEFGINSKSCRRCCQPVRKGRPTLANSGRLELQNRFHNFIALCKWQPREIALVVNKEVKKKVMNA
jgi:hypothetical protein